ncbi:MAG TPA: gliding motility-associated C-terminal domain-containing protein [Ferruginibacter sp.]|nr:gliding motility-associated C-terminal domain-containing protein [Ferruginibacter sp.]
MRKYILTYGILFFTYSLFGQKQTNIWYFGNKAGLDFNQTPPLVLRDGKASSFEGTSSMCDNNGKLLFYTNGQVIMNRQHLQMKNGGALSGHQSSTNNTLIVPQPGNDSIYYVFTTGAALQETKQFQYNIVNMKGDGGLGEVIAGNVLIEDNIFEKIAGVKHCNKRDAWILVHKWDSDEYHAYLLTAAGLSPAPVISTTGLVVSGFENNAIGTLKFSSKGTKLAAVHSFDNDVVELMDFNNTTGVISNPVIFKPNATPHTPSFIGVYGAEFSPNGNLLYVSANNSAIDPSVLYQFDITSGNAATILGTRQTIAKNTPWFAGALQLAPDMKIYMAMWKDTSVSVIDNPDVYGPGCNFNYNKIFMGPAADEPVQFGMPNFIQSYFDTASIPYDFNRSGSCTDRTIAFKLNRLSGIDSVKWDFGDTQQSQVLQPTHTYGAPGFYDVKLIVYKIDCSGLNDTINRRIWIADATGFLGADTSSCNLLALTIGVEEIEGANYLWSTGFNGNKITTTGFGTYWLEVQQNGCRIRDSITVTEKPKPTVSLGPDTSICKFKSVDLIAGTALFDTYLWNTGESTRSITVDKAGTYSVEVTLNGCIAADTVIVFPGDCAIFIPSAFTPNNDGLNETFGVLGDITVKSCSFQVFNKWGQMVFNTSDISQKWDGTYKGKKAPVGAYPWFLSYVTGNGKRKYQQGTVMLIR